MMEKIYNILADLHPEFDYRASDDFISDGMLDSFDIVSLVTSLEETYGFIIDALDILPENFCSAEAIADFICKNRSGR
jgi:acyl carrier protein